MESIVISRFQLESGTQNPKNLYFLFLMKFIP